MIGLHFWWGSGVVRLGVRVGLGQEWGLDWAWVVGGIGLG